MFVFAFPPTPFPQELRRAADSIDHRSKIVKERTPQWQPFSLPGERAICVNKTKLWWLILIVEIEGRCCVRDRGGRKKAGVCLQHLLSLQQEVKQPAELCLSSQRRAVWLVMISS